MSDEIVIESIKKMLQLQMPEEEIIASLVDAGVDYDYALKMVDSVKNKREIPKDKPVKKQEGVESSDQKESSLKDVDKTSLGVWQEGIITIINQKLDQIDSKQRALDEEIRTRVNSITSQELAKMKAVIDSQRALLASKLDLTVSQKLTEIKKQVDANLSLLQEINTNTQKKLAQMEELTKTLNDMKSVLSQQIDNVQNMRESLNSVIEDVKNSARRELQTLFDQYKSQIEEITARTNSALNLSSKILESLVNASERKIDDYLNTKIETFMKDLQTKINAEDIKQAIDKLSTIKDLDLRISNIVDNKLAIALSSQDTKKYDESITDLNRRIMELERLSRSGTSVNLEDIVSRLEELEIYKEQNSNLIAKLLKEKAKSKDKSK